MRGAYAGAEPVRRPSLATRGRLQAPNFLQQGVADLSQSIPVGSAFWRPVKGSGKRDVCVAHWLIPNSSTNHRRSRVPQLLDEEWVIRRCLQKGTRLLALTTPVRWMGWLL